MHRRLYALLTLPLLALLAGGCLDLIKSFIPVSAQDGEPGFGDAGTGFEGSVTDRLTVTGVKPGHGSFVGGTEVIISGTGFTKQSTVRIGGKAIQVGATKALSPVAIQVTTPPGEVGPADVEVSNGPKDVISLSGGFRYDPIHLDPDSGPTAGHTLFTLEGRGTAFADGMTLSLGGQPCSELEVISSTLLRAKTPPGADGPADLSFSEGAATHTVAGAFTYYASANQKSGGMGGGPIKGTLTVAVLDWLSRVPVVGATVVAQQERSFQGKATADAKGLVVFSDKDLHGPVTVTAAKAGYEASTLVSFDARDVTIFLMPIPKPQPGPLPPGTQAGGVEGYVLFGGATGAGSAVWKLVPEPKAGQIKRTVVFATYPSIEWGPQAPSGSATIDYTAPSAGKPGATAWPYALAGRTGSMAVYALAGLYTQATGTFDAYAMGITRGVVVGPGETQRADVWVQTALTEKLAVTLQGVPTGVARHRLRLALSLGADGILLRQDGEVSGDGPLAGHTFGRLPPLAGTGLGDASFTVDVQLEGTSADGLPVVHATERSVKASGGALTVAGFLGGPQQVKPPPGGVLEGNTLAWTYAGGPASLAVTTVRQSDDTPVWRVISPGGVGQVKLPDPATLGLPAWPQGTLVWLQWLAHLPGGFSFDTFNYSHLNTGYWDRWSFDQFELKVP